MKEDDLNILRSTHLVAEAMNDECVAKDWQNGNPTFKGYSMPSADDKKAAAIAMLARTSVDTAIDIDAPESLGMAVDLLWAGSRGCEYGSNEHNKLVEQAEEVADSAYEQGEHNTAYLALNFMWEMGVMGEFRKAREGVAPEDHPKCVQVHEISMAQRLEKKMAGWKVKSAEAGYDNADVDAYTLAEFCAWKQVQFWQRAPEAQSKLVEIATFANAQAAQAAAAAKAGMDAATHDGTESDKVERALLQGAAHMLKNANICFANRPLEAVFGKPLDQIHTPEMLSFNDLGPDGKVKQSLAAVWTSIETKKAEMESMEN